MNKLFPPVFSNTLKMKSSLLYFAFGLFPMILIIISLINTNFMQLTGEPGSLSALEFFVSTSVVQHNAVLPLIIIAYIASTLFFTEIDKGTLFLYKDLNRTSILNAKWFSLLSLYLIYLIILFVSSIIVYYVHLTQFDYTSGNFFPASMADFGYALIEFLGVFFIDLLFIQVVTALSINFSTGYAIFGGIVFFIITGTAPMLSTLKYFFPNGYLSLVGSTHMGILVGLVICIFIIYSTLLYFYSKIKFNKVEY
ncbi:hypothetical protein MHB50_01500 [Siminovitchia sp. FSL H7-0308]|uniref:ABC-2 type transport system permease protein n=1 Tax=Siminovitchia thermophila TaxID=1245522 RepID=A0ABS2R3S0_9BACI|nr:hypothetical protein [Siminovitchia thermophila]MBM7714030.1 ABC-2 type transport system permease protein [Siminovitchia thermophila]ONK21627.1 hypothetical protein BLX87_20615 [Bacillus sp. VT-16-64]